MDVSSHPHPELAAEPAKADAVPGKGRQSDVREQTRLSFFSKRSSRVSISSNQKNIASVK